MAVVFKPQKHAVSGSVMDRAAICVSAVCMVQCLLLPVLIVLTPLTTLGLFGEEWFHLAILGIIVPVSLLAFGLGYRTHRNLRMLGPGLTGLAIVILAAMLEDSLSPWGVAILTSFGGLLLILGHWLNLRDRRSSCLRAES